MQRAFIEHDGFQRGYCAPRQVVSAVGMLQEDRCRAEGRQLNLNTSAEDPPAWTRT
jgi:xanthine dehydrogenase YagT iron-sulfur-binding subunit